MRKMELMYSGLLRLLRIIFSRLISSAVPKQYFHLQHYLTEIEVCIYVDRRKKTLSLL